jgi:hypothetical protein
MLHGLHALDLKNLPHFIFGSFQILRLIVHTIADGTKRSDAALSAGFSLLQAAAVITHAASAASTSCFFIVCPFLFPAASFLIPSGCCPGLPL